MPDLPEREVVGAHPRYVAALLVVRASVVVAVTGHLGQSGASGWKVEPYFSGDSWSWSAYGPRGTRQGKTVGRERAERLAQQAERELSEPSVGADGERTPRGRSET